MILPGGGGLLRSLLLVVTFVIDIAVRIAKSFVCFVKGTKSRASCRIQIQIPGVSAYYHDSAAALLRDGEIVWAVQEERFARNRYDSSFPNHAIDYRLSEALIDSSDVQSVVFYDKPLLKFHRLLETYPVYAPDGLRSPIAAMPMWLKEKLFYGAFAEG